MPAIAISWELPDEGRRTACAYIPDAGPHRDRFCLDVSTHPRGGWRWVVYRNGLGQSRGVRPDRESAMAAAEGYFRDSVDYIFRERASDALRAGA